MRFQSIGRDKVDVEGCQFIQLNDCVQTDGHSCGIYCLKVCISSSVSIHAAIPIFLHMHRWLSNY